MENFWDLKVKEITGSFKVDKNYENWKNTVLQPWNKKTGYVDREHVNSSSMPVKELYTAGDLPDNTEKLLGYPGEYPFTRGVYPNMYRGRNWTMRMFSGFGTPDDTNKRLKYLI